MSDALGEALAAALAGRAAVVSASDSTAIDAVRAASETSETVLLLLAAEVPDLDKVMLLAAVGPLAIELAPHGRLVTIDLRAGAEQDDAVAAAVFLASAASTTGQILRVESR